MASLKVPILRDWIEEESGEHGFMESKEVYLEKEVVSTVPKISRISITKGSIRFKNKVVCDLGKSYFSRVKNMETILE